MTLVIGTRLLELLNAIERSQINAMWFEVISE